MVESATKRRGGEIKTEKDFFGEGISKKIYFMLAECF